MPEGSCLCGAVHVSVDIDLPQPNACHCSQCRKQTGHFGVSVDIPRTALRVTGAEHVRWYKSSSKAQRGFCEICGSTLFWDPLQGDFTAVAMGLFDTPTNTSVLGHIFAAAKGDYYDISDGLPIREQ